MENQKGIVEVVAERVWKFFSSVKLAVVLLIILAIVSVIGTVIQQNEAPEKYLQEYSQSAVDLFEFLGFFDMYHTWWFVLLLFLFTANLTVCTLERLPHSLRIITAPLKPIDDDSLRAVPFKKEFTFKGGGMDKAEERAAKVLRTHRYRFIESKGPESSQFMTQKGVYSRLGVYITHTSIILIFTGALIGSFFGFKAFLNLPEGSASKVVYLRNEPMWDRLMDALGIAGSPVIPNPQGGVPAMPIGFYVRCDSFDVDYYTQAGMPTGMPSEYHSTLSVYDLNEQKILEKRIRVNDPLTHHGITFYQSSYGPVPNARGKIILNIRPKNDPSAAGETVMVDPGASVYVASIDRTIKALGIAPYGMRDRATGQVQFYHTDNEEFINPTVELEVSKAGKPVFRTYVLKTDAGQPYMPEDYLISYRGYWGARYTGLQVTKDPGVWVVYTGFILLCVGPLIAFFGSHRKLWIRIQDRKGQALITVAGTANRNRLGFERDFNALVDEITK